MKREAVPDKPRYTEAPIVIFHTCDMQKEHKLLHLVVVNTGWPRDKALYGTLLKEEDWVTLFTAADLYIWVGISTGNFPFCICG